MVSRKPTQDWRKRAEARVKADPQLRDQATAIFQTCNTSGEWKFIALASTPTVLAFMDTTKEESQ
jgi:hypothetical protein